ncbi:MAG: response regulator [Candidatus Scalindua sp.]|nr:response regulator [Candidatus Scalindua sp.]MCR4344084.1 response regulator [Candidatus Scalindua sp.]
MGKAKILVADDVKQNVKLLRVILTASEYDVVEAYDGEEALEKAKTEKPDLILLDVMMPKLTGYEVCKKLRADEKTGNLPIVLITSLHEIDDRIMGIAAGADDFISKPFNKAELLARVKALLRTKKGTSQKQNSMVLEAIISHLTEGVMVADGQWKIMHMNQVAKDLLNIRETETENMDLIAYFAGMNLSCDLDKIKNSEEKTNNFLIYTSYNQHPYTISANLIKLSSEDRNIINIILILRKKQEGLLS